MPILQKLLKIVPIDILKFGVVGGLSTIIDFVFLSLFLKLGLSIFWALFFSYMLGAANGYLLNNRWTYGHLKKEATVSGFSSYAAISFIGLGLTEIIVYFLFNVAHVGIAIDKLVAVAVVFFWNFFANRVITFKNRSV